jgi:hypothetical protein
MIVEKTLLLWGALRMLLFTLLLNKPKNLYGVNCALAWGQRRGF